MRLLVLLVSVLALVVPRRRGSASPSESSLSSPVDPLPSAAPVSRRVLARPIASPAYRDGVRPVPEPARVRPYVIAAEHRRAERVWQGLREELAEIARTVVEQSDPDPVSVPGPVPVPGPASVPRLPRRRPGEHAPPGPDLYPPAPPAAAAAPPAAAACSDPLSDATLQRILSRLRELDAQATADAMAGATAGVGSVYAGGGW